MNNFNFENVGEFYYLQDLIFLLPWQVIMILSFGPSLLLLGWIYLHKPVNPAYHPFLNFQRGPLYSFVIWLFLGVAFDERLEIFLFSQGLTYIGFHFTDYLRYKINPGLSLDYLVIFFPNPLPAISTFFYFIFFFRDNPLTLIRMIIIGYGMYYIFLNLLLLFSWLLSCIISLVSPYCNRSPSVLQATFGLAIWSKITNISHKELKIIAISTAGGGAVVGSGVTMYDNNKNARLDRENRLEVARIQAEQEKLKLEQEKLKLEHKSNSEKLKLEHKFNSEKLKLEQLRSHHKNLEDIKKEKLLELKHHNEQMQSSWFKGWKNKSDISNKLVAEQTLFLFSFFPSDYFFKVLLVLVGTRLLEFIFKLFQFFFTMLRKYKNHFVLKQLYYAVINHPTPSNLTYAWNFGSLAFLCLMIQFITGISLAMHYIPHISMAFASVEHIMRDVQGGWLIRYGHANGASMFFIVVYIHIFRGLYYTSYTWPRQAVWVLGVVLLLLMIITAFMGYVLPWGQMSFWGATVITNLFSAIPYVGQDLVIWLWGNHSVSASTLTRFYALHFTLPFIILGVAVIHVIVLQYFGSNNPLGVHFMIDSIPFTPYYLLKDLFGFALFFAFFGAFIFFAPNMLNHPDNYIPANSTVTPPHIVPEWYFLPFYAVLRSVPNKIGGVILMLMSILVLFTLPFISVAEIRSFQFRTFSRYWFWLFVGVCVLLGWIGGQPAAQPFVTLSGCLTGSYFFLLLVGLPVIERLENYLLFNQRPTTKE